MNKTVRTILILGITLLVVAGFSVLCIISRKIPMNPEGTVGNTAGNLNNKGLFCEADGVVYFSNPYDKDTLYSMNPDETGLKKLGSIPVELINVGGKYLYYYQPTGASGEGLGYLRTQSGIYCSRLNGKKTIGFADVPVFSMQLVNNDLYYLTADKRGEHLYKKKIDTTGEALVADGEINPACVVNGQIYFNGTAEDHALYTLNTYNDSVSLVWEGDLWYPIVDGDYVYYMDVPHNYRLCRYSLSGNYIEILTEDRVDTYTLAGNRIYYQKSSSSDPCLIRMNIDGSNPEVVAQGVYSDLNVTSQYVYFHPFESRFPMYRTPVDGPVQVSEFTAAMNAALDNTK